MATYNVLRTKDFQTGEWLFGEATSDNVVRDKNFNKADEAAQIMEFNFSNDNSHILTRWRSNYQGINKANQVIHFGPKIHQSFIDANIEPKTTQAEISRIIGEAKFLRALFYFNLVKTFGDVPIVPEVLEINGNEDNFRQSRMEKDMVYDYIEKDLREAALAMFDRKNDNSKYTKGRATVGAALSYLVKIQAYRAESGVPGGHVNWKEALLFGGHIATGIPSSLNIGNDILNIDTLYSDEIAQYVNSSNVSADSARQLVANDIKNRLALQTLDLSNSENFAGTAYNVTHESTLYEYIFRKEGEFSQSSIFEINHVDDRDYNVSANWLNFNSQSGTKDIKDIMKGAPIFSNSYSGNKLSVSQRIAISAVEHGKKISFPEDDELDNTQSVNTSKGEPVDLYIVKWHSIKGQGSINNSGTPKNMRLLRFADIILLYAEALNECGFQQEAYDQLVRLYNRADKIVESGLTTANQGEPEKPFLDMGDYFFMRDQIWLQRRIELCFEFDRFFDIVRQKRAAELFSQFNTDISDKTYFKNFTPGINEVFPIPQEEITLSNGSLKQNKGY